MADTPLIEGRKKGGGGGSEVADTARSIQTAQLVDLISEGEIGGLVSGLKSVYLDGVPVENTDGTKNFEGFTFGIRHGTVSQGALPGFDTVQSEIAVAVEVRQSVPVVRTIVNPAVDTVRVTISVPQLTQLHTDSGNLTGATFAYAIDVQSAGGGFVQRFTETVSEKSTSNYKRATRLPLTGSGPWDIRVRRLTADSSSATLVNAFNWDSYTEIQSVELRYPNSAVAGIQVSAKQFSRIPARAYDILGIRVQVPSNYDPIAGTYAGIWDGTFKMAWTNNPAWIYYDLATHERYGVGQYIKPQHLDKWALYAIGRYCDVRVPDGLGGMEPRFTCNLVLRSPVQARQALQDLASLFRAITFWGNSQIAVVQDAPADAAMVFSKSNIVGDFAYESVSRKTRHSVWTVYYNDLTQLGRRSPVVYVDNDLVKQLGTVPDSFSPIGCTSRGQAMRLARWAAYSESAGRTVAFRAGAQAVSIGPGRVIKVADPNKAGKRLSGRVRTATTGSVTLDAPVAIDGLQVYMLEVILPDTTQAVGYRTEQRQVTNGAGDHQILTVSPGFSVTPLHATMWVLKPTNIQPTWWRVLTRKEIAGTNEFEIVGLAHDPDKFDAIENGYKLAPKPTSGLSVIAPKPTGVEISEWPYIDVSAVRIRATVSWNQMAPGLTYRVTWRQDQGAWTVLPDTSSTLVEIDGLPLGLLEVSVVSINSLGRVSAPASAELLLQGKRSPGPAVEGFAAVPVLGGIRLSWDPCDSRIYQSTRLFFGPALTPAQIANPALRDAALAAAVELWAGRGSSYDWTPDDDDTYTVWARHYDTSGNPSAVAPYLIVEYVASDLPILRLQASSQIFSVNDGDVSPASITFTASGRTAPGTVTFTVVAGSATLAGTGLTRTLAYADMLSDSVTVTAELGDLSDTTTVVKLRGGAGAESAVRMVLSNETHVLAASAAGVVSSYAGAWTTVRLYKGLTNETGSWTLSLEPTAGITAGLATVSGELAVVVSNMTSDSGHVLISATRAGHTAPAPVKFSLSKAKAGTDGEGRVSARVLIYRRSASGIPSLPSALATLTFSTGAITGLNNGWTADLPAGTDPCYVSAATASAVYSGSGTTATIAAVSWAGATLMVSNGAAGLSSATVQVYRRTTTASAPAGISGSTTYTFASGLLTGALGAWSQVAPPASDGKYLWTQIATALGTTATDDIASGEWSAVRLHVQDGETGASQYTLVPRANAVTAGSTAGKVGGANAWDSDVYSVQIYTGAAYAGARTTSTATHSMFGLSSNPLSTTGHDNLNYAIYFEAGTIWIYENGTSRGTFGAYTTASVMSIVYGGSTVRYYRDGVLLLTTAAPPGQKLQFKATFHTPGASIDSIAFGPSGPDGLNALQLALSPPAASVLADSSGNVVSGGLAQAVTTAKVTDGQTDVTSLWTISRTNGTGVTSSISGATITVTGMTVDTGEIIVTATRSGYTTQTARMVLTKVRSAAPTSGPVAQLSAYAIGVNASPGSPAVAAMRIETNGQVSVRNGPSTVFNVTAEYYTPPTANVGSSPGIWVKSSLVSGAAMGGTFGTWVKLTAALTFTLTANNSTGSLSSSTKHMFATDMAGANVVGVLYADYTADYV